MDRLRRFVSKGETQEICEHLGEIRFADSTADECPDCVDVGSTWVHLRMCMICGKPGCCNSSPLKHSAKHYEETGHPLVQTLESWEDWAWCFSDEVFLKPRQYRRAAD